MTEQEVRERIGKVVSQFPTIAEAACKLGLSVRHLTDIRAGRYPPPKWLLSEIGVQRRVIYEEVQ